MYTCALCAKKACDAGELDKLPKNCPCREIDKQEENKKLYQDDENNKLAYNSARVEAEGYCKLTRLEETMEFAKKCGFKKLGIAFCIGFSKEAAVLVSILKHNGFEVESVACKNGAIPKEFLNLKDEEKVRPGTFEPMCNPIGQARLLNDTGTDFNIILGLCVGHDSLFIKYSEAPVTVLVVKDRVLGHNPAAALYLSDSYYKNKLYK